MNKNSKQPPRIHSARGFEPDPVKISKNIIRSNSRRKLFLQKQSSCSTNNLKLTETKNIAKVHNACKSCTANIKMNF